MSNEPGPNDVFIHAGVAEGSGAAHSPNDPVKPLSGTEPDRGPDSDVQPGTPLPGTEQTPPPSMGPDSGYDEDAEKVHKSPEKQERPDGTEPEEEGC